MTAPATKAGVKVNKENEESPSKKVKKPKEDN
jgi:hypothetical protein